MVPQIMVTLQQAELLHLPIRYERAEIQQFYYDMSRKLYGGYNSLALTPGNIEMFTVYGSGGSSRFQLLPDRFRIIENNSGIKPEDFKARFEVTMASAANVFGVKHFFLQNVRLLVASQPLIWDNAVQFLAERICKLEREDLQSFGREPSAFTMNLRFLASRDENDTFNVKIEAYDQPQKTVTMDIEGMFGGGITPETLSAGAENIQRTFRFISEKTMAFLNRFDAAPEA